MRQANLGNVAVSRLCVGGNPFSGFSHQGKPRNAEMLDWFTPERIHETLRAAEALGINTLFARTDDHIFSVLREYWGKGGTIQWFAQVCPDDSGPDSWKRWLSGAADLGAVGLYIHGGVADHWHAQGRFDRFHEALDLMRNRGRLAGFAGHRPVVHEWINGNLSPDFQMCSYYNPTDRAQSPEHRSEGEKWDPADRDAMLRAIAPLPRPVVHYKVFGGGNRPIQEAFEVMGRAMRPNDVACIGVFPKDDPDMLAKDVALFERRVERDASGSGRG